MTLFETNHLSESTFTYEEIYIQKSSRPVANDQLIEIIAELFAEIIQGGVSLDATASIFTAKKLPSISLKDYLNRLSKFCYCSQEAFIIAMIFIDRFTSFNKSFHLHAGNIHRFYS